MPGRSFAREAPDSRAVNRRPPWTCALAGGEHARPLGGWGWVRPYAAERECVCRADSTISAPLKAITIARPRRATNCPFRAAEALVPMTHQRELRRARVIMAATQAAVLASRARRRKPYIGEPLRTSPR